MKPQQQQQQQQQQEQQQEQQQQQQQEAEGQEKKQKSLTFMSYDRQVLEQMPAFVREQVPFLTTAKGAPWVTDVFVASTEADRR
ncbi:hypothetical protein COO60DRAFT_1705074 [Scenedesmus sp. NREL 46B-D3]|nr:hypothetical protein COO60DRAFT_1705074 [Scenedesmus sp. NREL 46B-D3]